MIRCLIPTFLLILNCTSIHAQIAIYRDPSIVHPVVGYGGMVATQDAHATRAAAEVLAEGGNAIDAAVTAGFALAVTLPRAGNIGGGGFMLVHLAETHPFIGTSGRVFPTDLKSAPLLRAWLRRLRQQGMTIHVRHRWGGWNQTGSLRFATPQGDRLLSADAVVLALGGGSWSRFGSDGAWVPLLAGRGVPIEPLKPANCGFDVAWSPHLRGRYAGHPVKPVVVAGTTHEGVEFRQQGEFVVTETGIEGGVIYAISAWVRDEIVKTGTALLRLDLVPDRAVSRLISDLSRPRGSRSMASHLQRRVGLSGVKAGLLRECLSTQDFADPVRLGAAIKSLPVRLVAPRPLEEAISTAGGVTFEALDRRLMIRTLPGVFCAGEMLDWEAPTGGYLLTACFASGHAAGVGAAEWLQSTRNSTLVTF